MNFNQYKEVTYSFDSNFSLNLSSSQNSDISKFKLIPVGAWLLDYESLIEKMVFIRDENSQFFFQRFQPSTEGMRKYLTGPIFDDKRILLMIFSQDGRAFGHMGMKLLSGSSLEIDNVMKLEAGLPGLMTESFTHMLSWADHISGGIEMRAQVISTNQRAIDFYDSFGFKATNVINLRAAISPDGLTSLHDSSPEDSNTGVTKIIMTRDKS